MSARGATDGWCQRRLCGAYQDCEAGQLSQLIHAYALRSRLARKRSDESIVELDSLVESRTRMRSSAVSAIITFIDKHAGCTLGRNTRPAEKPAIGATGFENRHDSRRRPELLRPCRMAGKDVVTERRCRIFRCSREAHLTSISLSSDGLSDAAEDLCRSMTRKKATVQGGVRRCGIAFGA